MLSRTGRVLRVGLLVSALLGVGTARAEAPDEARAEAPVRPLLSLSKALDTAHREQPALKSAAAATALAESEVGVARAPLIPQLVGTASYQRLTGNFVLRPGAIPAGVGGGGRHSNNDTYNFWSFGATLSQLLYDSGRAHQRLIGEKREAESAEASQRMARDNVDANVRLAYFDAQGARALVDVSQAALQNNQDHLDQVQAFVEIGTRPEIDVAQVRVDLANAKVTWIQSKNGYDLSRLRLNQAMGIEGHIDFDVETSPLPKGELESVEPDALLRKAYASRGDLQALELRIKAREHQVKMARGGYGPSISASANVTDSGQEIDVPNNVGWNFGGGIFLTWTLFDGLLARGQVQGAKANLQAAVAERDALRQTIRVQVESARLTIAGAEAVLEASLEAERSAKQRYELADGRYEAGVGSIIELGDAQLALTQAEAQRVRAEVALSAARAQLLLAVGTQP